MGRQRKAAPQIIGMFVDVGFDSVELMDFNKLGLQNSVVHLAIFIPTFFSSPEPKAQD